MPNVCKMIGVVTDGVPILDRTINGENFMSIVVSFNDVSIPVIFSEHVLQTTELVGKVEVTGCLASDIHRNKLPKFFFYANDITYADEDSETSNVISYELKVTKNKGFQQNNQSRDILPLVCATNNPIKGTSVIYLCLQDQAARKLKSMPTPYFIKGTGVLKSFRDIYEIYTTDAELKA